MSDLNKPSDQDEVAQKPQRKPRRWIFQTLVEIPAGLLVLVVTIILLTILTPFGRNLATQTALNFLKLPEGYTLIVDNMTSPSIGEWHFDTLRYKYKGKTLVAVDKGVFDWAPLQIIQGKILVTRLNAEKIRIVQQNFPEKEEPPIQDEESQGITALLNALDATVEEQIQQFALKMFPVEVQQITIPVLEIETAEKTTRLKINAQAVAGQSKTLLSATSVVQLLAEDGSSIVAPITQIKLSVNYARRVEMQLISDMTFNVKEEPMNASARLNLSMSFAKRPLKLTIHPSEIQLNDEIIDLAGQLRFEKPDLIVVENTQIKGLSGVIDIDGKIKGQELDLNLTAVRIDPSAYIAQTSALVLNSNMQLSGAISDPNLTGNITGSGQLLVDDTPQQAYLSSDFDASKQLVEFSNTLVQFGDAKTSAEGQYKVDTKTLTAKANLEQLTSAQIATFNIPIPEQVNISVSDAVSDIYVQFPMEEEALALQVDVKGRLDGSLFTVPTNGSIDATITLQELNLHSANLKLNKAPLTGKGTANWRDKVIDMTFYAESVTPEALKWLPVEIPENIDTDLNAKILINGSFAEPIIAVDTQGLVEYNELELGTKCSVDTNLKALNIKECDFFEPGTTNKLMGHTGKIDFKPLAIDLQHEFNLFPVALITKALPEVLGVRNDLQLEGKLQGKASVSLKPQPVSLGLAAFTADLGFYGKAWSQPLFGGLRASGATTNKGLNLQINSLGLDYGKDTHLTLSAAGNSKDVTLQLNAVAGARDFKNLPYAAIEPLTQWPARLKVQTNISGSVKKPVVNGSLEYAAQIEQINALGKSVEVPLKLVADFRQPKDDLIDIDARIYKRDDLQSEFGLQTNALNIALDSLLRQQPFENLMATSKGQLNLANLNLLLSPVFHQFQGNALWDGQWQQGRSLAGSLAINDAFYQHLTLGTTFKNASLALDFENTGIDILSGSATDGRGGEFNLSGFLELAPFFNRDQTKTFARPTGVDLTLKNVQLIDRPDIESQATGTVRLESQASAYLLKGDIKLQPLEIQLDRTRQDNIPEIDVIEYNPRFESKGTSGPEKQSVPINLALNLKTDQQAYLRGKGINAELQGNIAVRGQVSDPRITGVFRTLRGDADILGKRFVINEGELRFDDFRGLINLRATHSKPQQDFIAQVTGSLDNLNVSLQSNPPLPEDETFSQLLFGKSLQDISAVQALRIAAAVRSLSSGGSGLDPLASTRNLLGVDQVTLESEETTSGNDAYKLGVGKYINERVYVEIQRSSDPTDPWQGQVQIELTPNISLETSAESTSGFGGVDLFWKRDY